MPRKVPGAPSSSVPGAPSSSSSSRNVPGAPASSSRTVPGAASSKSPLSGRQPTSVAQAAAPMSAPINVRSAATPSTIPSSQLRAAQNSLPRAQYLTFEEELTHDESADVNPQEISPIDVEVCGVGATQYDESFLWWLLATFHRDLRERQPLVVGISLSLQVNGQVDAILLSTRRRLLIIRTRHLLEDRGYNRVGKTRFSEHLIDRNDHLGALLYNRLYVERHRVHLVGFHAALQALHIHRATGLHSRMIDLSTDNEAHGYKPAHIRIRKAVTFKDKASVLAGLTRKDYVVAVDYNSNFDFDGYVGMANEAVSAFVFARFYPKLVTAESDERALVDTARLSLRDLGLGAQIAAAFHSINMLAPEMQRADFTDIMPGDEKGMLEVENERFSTRLMPNSQQTLQLRFRDGTMANAVTTRSHGKTSEIRILRADNDDDKSNTRTNLSGFRNNDVAEIIINGREDADIAQNHAVRFWFHVMRWRDIESDAEMKALQSALDPSGLFYPLFYGEAPVVTHVGVSREVRKFGPPSEDQRYSVIDTSKLDPSQRDAAQALAGPVRTHSDRLKLIHGPPGTGKTTVIAQFCKQWASWVNDRERDEGAQVSESLNELTKPFKAPREMMGQRDKYEERGDGYRYAEDDQYDSDCEEDAGDIKQQLQQDVIRPEDIVPSTWCVCQSNAAVKNIAEGLKKAGVRFKIFVSDSFYLEWHEHIYTALSPELIVTSALNTTVGTVKQELSGICVFLGTISGLSSHRLEDAQLFTLRPIYTLLVDEASQIPLGAYPHLLSRHSQTMSRIAFFGDHKQLAPFGADTIESIESVFELRHLVERAYMLKRCYRLPRPLCNFVSREVYDGLLTSGKGSSKDTQEPLTKSVRFIDVDSGRESRGENSFENTAEARCIATFVAMHMQDVDFRVLAPYTRQRDAVERELKLQNLPWEGRVFTVDSFQGQEADVIIVSLVRDGLPEQGHTAGFLTNERRSNVLITRCKIALYVFTSKRFLLGPEAKGRDTLIGALGNLLAMSDPSDDDEADKRKAVSRASTSTTVHDDEMAELGSCMSSATLEGLIEDDDGDDDDDDDEEGTSTIQPRARHAGWRSEVDVALGRAALAPPPGGFEPPAQHNAPVADLSALALDVNPGGFTSLFVSNKGESGSSLSAARDQRARQKTDGVDNSTLRIAAMLAEQGGKGKGKARRR